MSINRQMARGAAWTIGMRMLHRSFGFVSTLILARLLVPADFGLIAMATVFMALLFALSELSIRIPLIQKDEVDREDLDSAWSLQVLVGLGQAGVLIAIAEPAARFFSEPRLTSIVYVLAVTPAIKGFNNIGMVLFQREMVFHKEFMLLAGQRVLSFATTIGMALAFRSYWALISGMLIGSISEVALSYAMHPYRPMWSRTRWRGLFGFSKWLLVSNMLAFMVNRGSDIILGRLLGPGAVGMFSVANEVATLPTTEIVMPINRAVFPGYSKIRQTEAGLNEGFTDVLGLIALMVLPCGLGIAATANLLVPLLLGANWLDAIDLVHHLAIAGAVSALLSNGGAVFLALGRPKMITGLLVLRVLVLVPAMLAAGFIAGIEGIALAFLGTALIDFGANVAVLLTTLRMHFVDYLRAIYRPVVSSTVMYTGLSIWVGWSASGEPVYSSVAAIFMVVTGAALFYFALVFCLWAIAGRPRGAEHRLLSLTAERLGPRAPVIIRKLLKPT